MRALVIAAVTVGGSAGCGDNLDSAPSIEVVGHSDLSARGMNSAPAIVGDYLYVGSRTDGDNHENAGILIVDISDPSEPSVVGQIGRPQQDISGISSRELRALPDEEQLIVLNFPCAEIHDCSGTPAEQANIKIYDVRVPTEPVLLGTRTFYVSFFSRDPGHEFYLWRDPGNPQRVLLFLSTPLGPPAFQVWDISEPTDITAPYAWDPWDEGGIPEERSFDNNLHSVSVSDDGAIGFFSSGGAGFYLVDTSGIAAGEVAPDIRLLTPVENRIDNTPPLAPGTHSATPVPGRSLVVVTDEVYPVPVAAGCPWGWARFVDYSDQARPVTVGEYRVEENDPSACDDNPLAVTFTAHNTTNTANLSLISWHSSGLHVVDTTDPSSPTRLAQFLPTPIPSVATEDPALGGNPVLMWSYPIIRDGLIYVVDIRNGLYILRYTGPHQAQIRDTSFLEGNSNTR